MNDDRSATLCDLAQLFRYPQAGYAATARRLAEQAAARGSAAAAELGVFAAYAEATGPAELEEIFARTFDLNPSCAPEIGWHLFGEEYARGLLLVRLRQELRAHGVAEAEELPDHLGHVLPLLAAMDEEPGRRFAQCCVAPAAGKMLAAIERAAAPDAEPVAPTPQTAGAPPEYRAARPQRTPAEPQPQPFRPLVAGLAELLLELWALPRTTLTAVETDAPPAGGQDVLHRSPCGGCSPEPELVALQAAGGAADDGRARGSVGEAWHG
jgi:nitrate reductase delta subunit